MLIHRNTTLHTSGLDFVCNSGKLDRYGDIVVPSGIDLTQFRKNPIALLNHAASAPIGVWTDVRVEAGELRGRLERAPEKTSPRIDEIRKLVEAKVLRACSIGFMPVEFEPILDAKGARTGGMRFLKSELIEMSLVSTPADGNAVARAKSLNISDATLREVFRPSGEVLTVGQRIRKTRQALQKAKALRERADTAAKRKALSAVISHLERHERELVSAVRKETTENNRRAEYGRKVRAKALATLKRLDAQIARQGQEAARPADPWGIRAYEAELYASFGRHHKADPIRDQSEGWQGQDLSKSWRGQALPSLTWRGRKI